MAKRRKTSRSSAPPASDDDDNSAQHRRQSTNRGNNSADNDNNTSNGNTGNKNNLILTSEKKRGVYECDYCRSDISQQPRIRCAVCAEFDVCLDCFSTADGTARLQTSSHSPSHGYRVCDSTRFAVLISSNRSLVGSSSIMNASSSTTSATNTSHANNTANAGIDVDAVPVTPAAAVAASVHASGTAKTTPATATTTATPKKEMKTDKPDSTSTEAKAPNDNDDNDDNDDKMDVDTDKNQASKDIDANKTVGESDEATDKPSDDGNTASPKKQEPQSAPIESHTMIIADDPKSIWTAEEDLRLLDAIMTFGLGNWSEICEAISGNGSFGKTPKRCMERYFDDYLGRYGHILPRYTIVDDGASEESSMQDNGNINSGTTTGDTPYANSSSMEDETIRLSKRRHAQLMRSPSNVSTTANSGRYARKKIRVVETTDLPGYQKYWPSQKIPPIDGIQVGQDLCREQSYKSELTFVKVTNAASTKEEADRIRQEWMETRMKEPGAPTVLPPRTDDIAALPGADLAGYMPRRADLDIEHENDAEQALADMEFNLGDPAQDKELKVQVLQIYCRKLDERERRKNYIISRNLYNYRKHLKEEQEMPTDERDLLRRMRLFERFHTPQEHEKFLADILKAKRLRKEIAKLQMYRRMGIKSLAEAEKYELDKSRRQFHKMSQLQKEAELKNQGVPADKAASSSGNFSPTLSGNRALWKQYWDKQRNVNQTIEDKPDGVEKKATAEKEVDEKQLTSKSQSKVKVKSEASDEKSAAAAPESASGNDSQAMEVDNNDCKSDKATAEVNGNVVVGVDFDVTKRQGYDLLSPKEAGLCKRMKLYPQQYLHIKKALLYESMKKGLLDNEGPGSSKRIVVKMDIERRGTIVDFMLRAGWISSDLADAAKSVAT